MIGVEVANEMSDAVAKLGNISSLIVDLRGNTGGGAGALRMMSLMTPNRIPVGYAPNKQNDLSCLSLKVWGRDPIIDKQLQKALEVIAG
jgi:C-terminal processing protease CtpA/Prc